VPLADVIFALFRFNCSDILTPLPGIGVPFEIDDLKGPIIDNPVTSLEQVQQLHELDLDQLEFIGESLSILRQEVGNQVIQQGLASAISNTLVLTSPQHAGSCFWGPARC
jgi:uroporphyrinogen-III decarboxylase